MVLSKFLKLTVGEYDISTQKDELDSNPERYMFKKLMMRKRRISKIKQSSYLDLAIKRTRALKSPEYFERSFPLNVF